MTKLEQLKQTVAQMFENATEKEDIERLAKVNNSIAEVEQEQKELTDQNAELIKSYKELVKHTSFKEKPKEVETQPTRSQAPSLEEELAKFLASQNKEEK